MSGYPQTISGLRAIGGQRRLRSGQRSSSWTITSQLTALFPVVLNMAPSRESTTTARTNRRIRPSESQHLFGCLARRRYSIGNRYPALRHGGCSRSYREVLWRNAALHHRQWIVPNVLPSSCN
ncbi:hypothetical protein SUTH_00519 [Sulfuritalea hydrogenivorans sk43H]|uniref:Uncharacterized protein n=1 Tax=Sulfuritalea hydrogenivorans sk43H TaxID=1223802 RepID=W0SF55_9PROT|nr:hypothetical protein SUTH_00519 [Sulfuritalea hydrogenivorans sk43H]